METPSFETSWRYIFYHVTITGVNFTNLETNDKDGLSVTIANRSENTSSEGENNVNGTIEERTVVKEEETGWAGKDMARLAGMWLHASTCMGFEKCG